MATSRDATYTTPGGRASVGAVSRGSPAEAGTRRAADASGPECARAPARWRALVDRADGRAVARGRRAGAPAIRQSAPLGLDAGASGVDGCMLDRRLPDAVLILDGTSFPKQSHRTGLPRTQGRTGPRSLRRALVAGVASSRHARDDGLRVSDARDDTREKQRRD